MKTEEVDDRKKKLVSDMVDDVIESDEKILASGMAGTMKDEESIESLVGSIIIERQYKISKEEETLSTKTLKTPITKFITTPAKVAVKYGVTMNMGNYESARVDVTVEMPCYKEDVHECYALVSSYVEELISDQIKQINSDGKKKDDVVESKGEESPF